MEIDCNLKKLSRVRLLSCFWTARLNFMMVYVQFSLRGITCYFPPDAIRHFSVIQF